MGGFSCWRTSDKLLNFGKMIVKALKCRWFISQNKAHFSSCKSPQMSINVNKSVIKMRGYCQYFRKFSNSVHLARMF